MPLRRYAPALIIAAALLLLVIVAPSKSQPTGTPVASLGNASQVPPGSVPTTPTQVGSTPGTTPGTVASSATGRNGAKGIPGAGATTQPGNRPGSNGQQTGSSGSTGSGSTAHCVGGKQFAVPGFSAAPPCQPTFHGNNGGATFRGVTASRIEVVVYQAKQSLALKAILGPAGLDPSVAQVDDYINRATSFINSRYELWGRKIHVDDFVSQSCQASPPTDACFRQDAQTIVSKYHPFAVMYPRNLTAPGFQQELSHLGVVNLGGITMPASYDREQAPYHYDYNMDGDTQAEITGEWYCQQMANHKASYAGSASLRTKERSAEILSEDTPEHVAAAQHLAAIINHCDHGGGATIKTYSPDTAQAVIQATTLASQAKQSGITTLLYFTDPVFPVYLTPQLTAQNFYPENVVVGSGKLDFDALGQLYDPKQWRNAFGVGQLPDMATMSRYDAGAVYRATHGSLGPFISAANLQGYFSVLSDGLQQAGPDLTPMTFEHGVLTLPPLGGTRYHALMEFGPGDFTGVSDVRLCYWDTSRHSPINGKLGTYVALDHGRRFALGQFPRRTFTLPGRG